MSLSRWERDRDAGSASGQGFQRSNSASIAAGRSGAGLMASGRRAANEAIGTQRRFGVAVRRTFPGRERDGGLETNGREADEFAVKSRRFDTSPRPSI